MSSVLGLMPMSSAIFRFCLPLAIIAAACRSRSVRRAWRSRATLTVTPRIFSAADSEMVADVGLADVLFRRVAGRFGVGLMVSSHTTMVRPGALGGAAGAMVCPMSRFYRSERMDASLAAILQDSTQSRAIN